MLRNGLPREMKHYSPTGRRNQGRPLKRLLDTWDRKGSRSGPTPWKIYDGEFGLNLKQNKLLMKDNVSSYVQLAMQFFILCHRNPYNRPTLIRNTWWGYIWSTVLMGQNKIWCYRTWNGNKRVFTVISVITVDCVGV